MDEKIEAFSYVVEEAGRLDLYLTSSFDDYSRTYIQKLIKEDHVLVNGVSRRASYILKKDDVVTLQVKPPQETAVLPEDIQLDILYDDDDIVIVNKKQGMVVHPAPGNNSGTLVNALVYHYKDKLSEVNGVLRPGIVHRIDKDTAGILVVAKNTKAHIDLSEQFKVHSITRVYHAIVVGNMKEDKGTIDKPIGRSEKDRKKMEVTTKNSRRAVTNFRVLEQLDGFTHVACRLETGRTHQIRVHLSYIGYPILGDQTYQRNQSLNEKYSLEGQLLFAKKLGFIHPTTREYIEFEVELPDYFKEMLERLKARN